MSKCFLLRLPEEDFLRYQGAARRRRMSTAAFLRESVRLGARQLGGEKAVAPVQNRPLKVAAVRRPLLPVGRVGEAAERARALAAQAGGCNADVAYGTVCKLCGRVHR